MPMCYKHARINHFKYSMAIILCFSYSMNGKIQRHVPWSGSSFLIHLGFCSLLHNKIPPGVLKMLTPSSPRWYKFRNIIQLLPNIWRLYSTATLIEFTFCHIGTGLSYIASRFHSEWPTYGVSGSKHHWEYVSFVTLDMQRCHILRDSQDTYLLKMHQILSDIASSFVAYIYIYIYQFIYDMY